MVKCAGYNDTECVTLKTVIALEFAIYSLLAFFTVYLTYRFVYNLKYYTNFHLVTFYLLTYGIIVTRIWNLSQYWELYEGNLDKTYILNFTELLCSTAKLLMGIV